jgi:Tol biopolymer transport system component
VRDTGGNILNKLRVLLLIVFLLLAACGDEKPATSTGVTTSPSVSIPVPTSTPVVLAQITASSSAVPLVTTTARITASATSGAASITLPSRQLPAGLTGKLSLLGNDGQVYVQRFDGKGPQLLLGQVGSNPYQTGDGTVYIFPTWSRDGKKLAAISANFKGGTALSSDVWVVKEDGTGAYKARDGAKAGGIYLNFSPDGNNLTMLVGGNATLELLVADTSDAAAGKPANPRKLAEGQPLYSSWSPDNDRLLVRATAQNSEILNFVSAKNTNTMPVNFVGTLATFRAPEWSNDGTKLAYALAGKTTNDLPVLVVADKDGKEIYRLDGAGSGMAFNWSPDSKFLAFGNLTASGQGFYESLSLAEISGGKLQPQKIADGPVLAFFWSPDSKKIAYVTLNSAGNLFAWNIYDLPAKKSTLLAEWAPSEAMAQVLSYFDQYAQSDSVWSPDSKALVFGGWDKVSLQGVSSQSNPSVYIVLADGTSAGQIYLAGAGDLGFWAR